MKRSHCLWCGEKLTKEKKRKFCSQSCMREHDRYTRLSRAGEQDWKEQTRICPFCGDEFQPKYIHDKYCSASCRNRARKERNK